MQLIQIEIIYKRYQVTRLIRECLKLFKLKNIPRHFVEICDSYDIISHKWKWNIVKTEPDF